MIEVEYSWEKFFTMEELRAHLRVYHDEDDLEIQAFCDAGLETAAGFIGGTIIDRSTTLLEFLQTNNIQYSVLWDNTIAYDDNYWIVPFNKRIRAAVLLFVGDLYQNREANTDYNTYENRAFSLLLNGMRNINIRQVGV